MLAGFMEERNILWGELAGGLLILGCSVALVVYLLQTQKEIRYFPFYVVAGVTAALFGAGTYAERRWKLETTSRGLLIIATLLVPLSFLVLAGLSRGAEVLQTAPDGELERSAPGRRFNPRGWSRVRSATRQAPRSSAVTSRGSSAGRP